MSRKKEARRKPRRERSDAEYFNGRTLLRSAGQIESEIRKSFGGSPISISLWRGVSKLQGSGRTVTTLDLIVREAVQEPMR